MNLKRKLISAIGWSVAIKLAVQIVIWAMTLMVIRIIPPGDYGLMAITQLFVNFMAGFASLGLGDALIQRNDTPPAIVARVFGAQIAIALALTLLMDVAAYPVAAWYADPRLIPLIQVSSLSYLFFALTSLPRAYLAKNLRVRPMFIVEAASGLVGAGTVILLAFAGHGVWALMWGTTAGHLARTIAFALVAPEYFVWPRFGFTGMGELFSFGIYRTLEFTVWVIFSSADIFVISTWLGPTAVGVYSVASNFASMPLSKIAPIVNSTIFPAFAMVQERAADARFYALKGLRIMAVTAVPIFFGISATAPEIVDIVFGPNWLAAKPVLAILALANVFKVILLIIPNYLQGLGDSRAGFWCTASGALIFPPAFAIGCHWGVVGIAWAWFLGYFAVYPLNALIAARRGGLDLKQILLIPMPPMIAGAIMMVAVAAARDPMPPELPEAARFAVLVCVGAVVYGTILFVGFRALVMELIRPMLRRSSPAT